MIAKGFEKRNDLNRNKREGGVILKHFILGYRPYLIIKNNFGFKNQNIDTILLIC